MFKIPSSIKSVAWLSGVNIISQIIPFLMLPVFSGFYGEKEFAYYGLCLAIASPLAVIFSLRYENAIVPADTVKESMNLFYLSLMIVASSLLFFGVLFFFSSTIVLNYFHLSGEFTNYWLAVPVIAASMAIGQILNFWWVRFMQIKFMNSLKFLQAVFYTALVIGFGYLQFNSGLLLGDVFSRLMVALFMGSGLFFILYRHYKPSAGSLKQVAGKYKNFPLQSTLPSLLDAVSLSMIVWLVSSKFSETESGNFNLARMVIAIPISVLTVAVGQVFLSNYSKRIHAGLRIWPLIRKQFFYILITASSIALAYYSIGREIFEWIFGAKWHAASGLSIYIIVSSLIKFCISPISVAIIAYKDLKWISVWQVISFIGYIILFFIDYKTIEQALVYMLMLELILYAVYFYFIFITVKANERI